MSSAIFIPSFAGFAGTIIVPATRGPMCANHGVVVSRGRLATDAIGNFTLTLSNVVVGSAIQVEARDTAEVLYNGTAAATTVVLNLSKYQAGDAKNDLRIKVRKGTATPFCQPYETQVAAIVGSSSIYVNQLADE